MYDSIMVFLVTVVMHFSCNVCIVGMSAVDRTIQVLILGAIGLFICSLFTPYENSRPIEQPKAVIKQPIHEHFEKLLHESEWVILRLDNNTHTIGEPLSDLAQQLIDKNFSVPLIVAQCDDYFELYCYYKMYQDYLIFFRNGRYAFRYASTFKADEIITKWEKETRPNPLAVDSSDELEREISKLREKNVSSVVHFSIGNQTWQERIFKSTAYSFRESDSTRIILVNNTNSTIEYTGNTENMYMIVKYNSTERIFGNDYSDLYNVLTELDVVPDPYYSYRLGKKKIQLVSNSFALTKRIMKIAEQFYRKIYFSYRLGEHVPRLNSNSSQFEGSFENDTEITNWFAEQLDQVVQHQSERVFVSEPEPWFNWLRTTKIITGNTLGAFIEQDKDIVLISHQEDSCCPFERQVRCNNMYKVASSLSVDGLAFGLFDYSMNYVPKYDALWSATSDVMFWPVGKNPVWMHLRRCDFSSQEEIISWLRENASKSKI